MNILITICARGGSKGVPGKNIKEINGKPLILYTYEHAKNFAELHNVDIQLSSDDEKIVQILMGSGYSTEYRRPVELATDKAGKTEAIRDAWKFAELKFKKVYDYVIDLDVTSPLRTCSDLNEALYTLILHENALNIFSVNEANRNPYFNMVEESQDGYYKVVKNTRTILSRQMAPKVYDMNASFYIFSREFMEGNYTSSTTERSLAFIMDHICFDIDHPIDFEIINYLISNRKLGFEFNY